LLGFGALAAGKQKTERGAAASTHEAAITRKEDSPSTVRFVGTTDYDPATLTVVRTPFDCRVDKVLVDLGSTVKRGDLLLELFSANLAEAKINYEAASRQWSAARKSLNRTKNGSIGERDRINYETDEAARRLKTMLTKDKLLLFGLSEEDIENSSKEDGV